jgi:hypothetical protein
MQKLAQQAEMFYEKCQRAMKKLNMFSYKIHVIGISCSYYQTVQNELIIMISVKKKKKVTVIVRCWNALINWCWDSILW